MSRNRRLLLITALALYALLVFVVDAIVPLGLEVWVLNLPVFLVPMLFRNASMVMVASLTCSVMVIIGSAISPPGGNPRSWDLLNRFMGLATIWLITGMALNSVKRSKQFDHLVRSLKFEIAQHSQTSRSLEQSEERQRLAVEGVGMGTFDLNVKTGKIYCSATHLRMIGYHATSDGETSTDAWDACTHTDDQARIQEARDQALRNRSLYSVEYRIRRVDTGAIVWLAVFGRWYYNEAGEGVRFLGLSFDVTRRKQLEHQLLDITAQTQRQIGQELHDGVGQELTGLGLMAQTLSQRLEETDSEHRLALRLVAGLNQLHEQIRALAFGLVPVAIENKGLRVALEDLAAITSEQAGIPIRFECPQSMELPDHATSMELYRITQEAVSNALRHGKARQITLSILPKANSLLLRIQDDGIGFPNQPPEGQGLGIRIMEYRAALIGGIFSIQRGDEGGTVVTVKVPWRQANDVQKPDSAVLANQHSDCGRSPGGA
jgi:PAS domain S-box-containing protein